MAAALCFKKWFRSKSLKFTHSKLERVCKNNLKLCQTQKEYYLKADSKGDNNNQMMKITK